MLKSQAVFATLSALLAGLSLGGAEGLARWYEAKHPSPEVDFSGGFSARSRVFGEIPGSPGMLRTNVPKNFAFVDQTFSRHKSPGALRVAVLGESSVNYLQNDLQALRPRLATALQRRDVDILNAGGKSYGSQRLALVAEELRDYEPDVLVLYLGNNEFEEVEQLHLIRPELAPALSLFYRSAVVRVTTGALFSARVAQLRRAHAERMLEAGPDVTRAWTYPFTDRDVRERMAEFDKNLRKIVEFYHAHPTRLILATIPSNYVRPDLPPAAMKRYQPALDAYKAGNFAEASRLGHELLRTIPGRHQSSDWENEIIRRVADDYRLPLIDVVKAVEAAEPHHVLGETLFADHCHLNARGNALLAGLFERAIVRAAPTH